jgi:hypothetical protein
VEDLELYLRDDVGAWLLGPDGTYARAGAPAKGSPTSAQAVLLERHTAAGGSLSFGT